MSPVKFCLFLFAVLAPLVTLSCTSMSDEAKTSLPTSAADDDAYQVALAKWSREAHVFYRFQKVIDANVVLFTEEFRRAFLERWTQIRGDGRSNLDEMTSGKSAALVSLYTPDFPYMSLDNSRLWTIEMQFGEKKIAPSIVRWIDDKPLLEPYFPFLNKWTREFLVIFDTASPSGETFVLPNSVQLSLRSSLVSTEFAWK